MSKKLEFDLMKVNEGFDKSVSEFPFVANGPHRAQAFSWWQAGARWQFEQDRALMEGLNQRYEVAERERGFLWNANLGLCTELDELRRQARKVVDEWFAEGSANDYDMAVKKLKTFLESYGKA